MSNKDNPAAQSEKATEDARQAAGSGKPPTVPDVREDASQTPPSPGAGPFPVAPLPVPAGRPQVGVPAASPAAAPRAPEPAPGLPPQPVRAPLQPGMPDPIRPRLASEGVVHLNTNPPFATTMTPEPGAGQGIVEPITPDRVVRRA